MQREIGREGERERGAQGRRRGCSAGRGRGRGLGGGSGSGRDVGVTLGLLELKEGGRERQRVQMSEQAKNT